MQTRRTKQGHDESKDKDFKRKYFTYNHADIILDLHYRIQESPFSDCTTDMIVYFK